MNNLIKAGDVVKFKNMLHFIVKEVLDGVILVEGNEGVFPDDLFTLTTSTELTTTSDLKRIWRAYKEAINTNNVVKLKFLTDIYTKDAIPYPYKRMILDVLQTFKGDDVYHNEIYNQFLKIHKDFIGRINFG